MQDFTKPAAADDHAGIDADWFFACNRDGRVTELWPGREAPPARAAELLAGRSLADGGLQFNGRDGGGLSWPLLRLRRERFAAFASMGGGHRYALLGLPRRDASGEFDGFVLCAFDPAGLGSDHSLRLRLREFDQLWAAISHELQNPLNSIRGYLELLERRHGDSLPEDGRRMLGLLQRSSARLYASMQQLQAWQGLSAQPVRTESMDLSALCGEIVQELGAGLEGGPRVSVEPGMLIHADPRMMRTVFTQLLSNAWRYTASVAAPLIQVGSTLHAQGRLVRVVDNGIGLGQGGGRQLFTPFGRVHSAPHVDGVGMGLVMAARAAERTGAWVWADCQPGPGAEFFVDCPTDPQALSLLEEPAKLGVQQ